MSGPSSCKECGGTLPDGVFACPRCGAPKGEGDSAALGSVWEAILEKLREGAAPKYEVRRLLGFGGMAGVYHAHERRLGRDVAIKVMAPGLMVDPQLVERFEQEARTIAQLRHPNVITVFDVAEAADLHYFVMSYARGRTLGQVLATATSPLPIPVFQAWLSQIGGALDYAHREGVVHRDVKPGNVLLDRDGNALVTDFGIAKVADQPGLTRTGMLIGTPAYMSPEQCSTGHVTGASDQYSLGAVAYQMLTGAPPFTGQTLIVLQAHLGEPPRPILELRPDCPPEVAAAVDRMLAKSPEERWPTLGDGLDAMGAAPVGYADPVRIQMVELAAWLDGLTLSSTRGVNRPPVPSSDVEVGDTFVLTAVANDAEGRVLHDRRVSWLSGNPDVASVAPDGTVRALKHGTAQIIATCEGVRDWVMFRIPGEAEVSLGEPEATVAIGSSVELESLLGAREGGVPSGPDAVWTSSDPSIARVTAEGRVQAVRPGSATIVARVGGRSTSVVLTVTPVPGHLQAEPPEAPVEPSGSTGDSWKHEPPEPDVASAEAIEAGEERASVTSLFAPDGVEGVQVAGAGSDAAPAPATILVPAPAQAPAGRRNRWIAAGVGVAVVVVSAIGLAVRGSSSSEEPSASSLLPAVSAGPDEQAAEDETPPGGTVVETADDDAATSNLSADPTTAATEAGAEGDAGQVVAAEPEPEASTPAERLPPPEPVLPRDGTIRILGDLPAESLIEVSGSGIARRAVQGSSVELPPGTYVLEFSAPGFEFSRDEITLGEGSTRTWSPALTQVQEAVTLPPEPEGQPAAAGDPPAGGDPAAGGPEPDPVDDSEGVTSVVQALVRSLGSGSMAEVRSVFPGASGQFQERWRQFWDNVSDLNVTLANMGSPSIDGDVASVDFTALTEYRDFRNQRQSFPQRYTARLRKTGPDWTVTDLTAIN